MKKINYPGGKGTEGVYQQIINQIPPHINYYELFFGGGGVFAHKLPAQRTVLLDKDPAVVKMWKLYKKTIDDTAILGERIPAAALVGNGERFEPFPPGTLVKKGEAISYMLSHKWKPTDFIYLDPPYLFSTRKSKDPIYNYEFGTEEEHTELLKVIKTLPCMVAISGYYSKLYKNMLKGWRTINYKTGTRGGGVAVEWLWMNYAEPLELHDFRYYGNNFREREKYKKQRKRHLARLGKMKAGQRYLLLSAIREVWGL